MTQSKSLFLYGTLRYPELLARVAGTTLEMRPATLKGFAVHQVDGAAYPMILRDSDGVIEGCLIEPDEVARARLDYYESGFGYHVESAIAVSADGETEVDIYLPPEGNNPAAELPWSLDKWVAEDGALSLAAASEMMMGFGTVPAEELRSRFMRHRARVWSRILAQKSASAVGDPKSDIRELSRKRVHSGFFATDEITVDYPQFDRNRSGPVMREVFVVGDAAIILPYDPVNDLILLVEQFRAGFFRRGTNPAFSLEPVAGLIDPGEEPEETARREAMEEAGLSFSKIVPAFDGHPSPGATTEYSHCFVGLCDLSNAGGQGGLAQEHEDILAHVLPRGEAMERLMRGEINVLPLQALLFWLELNHSKLTAAS